MTYDVADLASKIRDIPDFPKPGVLFKDITTLLKDRDAFRRAIDLLRRRFENERVDQVVSMESRGFIFGAPLAYVLGAGFVPVRKSGKLPSATLEISYDLEYGSNVLAIHRDAIQPGERVLIVDDLLATGGTVAATIDLVRQLGGEIVGIACLIELTFLNGRARLPGIRIESILTL